MQVSVCLEIFFFLVKMFTVNVLNISTGGDFMKEDYNILETIMLKLFDWDMNIPTTATFGSYYAEFVVSESDFNDKRDKMYQSFEEFKSAIKSDVMHFIDKSLFGE